MSTYQQMEEKKIMNKGLKKLKELHIKLCENCPYNKPNMDGDVCSKCEEALDIIEKELKRLYGLEKTTVTFSNVQQIMLELDKSKKALEIIKENFVPYDIEMLKNGKVRIWVGHDKYFDVSEEQFDLLKEMFRG